jgi:uncharacterized protein with HEPN domain
VKRLADVLAAIDRLRRYVQDDRARFDTDELLHSAVLHWIEITGEAARGVGDKVRTAHPEVPWRVITDMRNRVSHGYFDIDLDVVWNTVTRDLPKLQECVTRILAELDSEAEDSRVSSLLARRWPMGDIAPVDVTSTGYTRLAELVNLYKSLCWEPLMPRISLSRTARG